MAAAVYVVPFRHRGVILIAFAIAFGLGQAERRQRQLVLCGRLRTNALDARGTLLGKERHTTGTVWGIACHYCVYFN